MTGENIGVQGFISYVRKDNEAYAGVVDRLKHDLEERFHAVTGRRLEIFLDRDSIGWGDDWRASIGDSVKTATFFIPVVTMRFFESDACRDELIAFYENAKQLGVQELILPVLLAGADQISADDARQEVQLIDRLNYKSIEEPWLDGYDSPAWNRMIHAMVGELARKLEAAELTLETAEGVSTELVIPHEEAVVSVQADATALGEEITALTETTGELQAVMQRFGDAAKEVSPATGSTPANPQQQQQQIVRMARALREPAQSLADLGSKLERQVAATDVRLRAVVGEMRSIDADMARDQLAGLLGALSGLDEVATVHSQLNQLTQMLRLVAVMNVTMRSSVQPAINGLQSVESALATVQSWRSL